MFTVTVYNQPAGELPAPLSQFGQAKRSLLSFAYIWLTSPICFRLLTQMMRVALALTLASAGNNNDARIAMIAMTTSSSIKVKARFDPGSVRFMVIVIALRMLRLINKMGWNW